MLFHPFLSQEEESRKIGGKKERQTQRVSPPGELRAKGPKEHLETGGKDRDRQERNINRCVNYRRI